MLGFLAFVTLGLAAQAAPVAPAVPAPQKVAVQPYEVVRTYPHDRTAFTQGLFFSHGALFESTGMLGQSTVRQVRLEDGKAVKSASLPAHQFGEGSTSWGDEIISLTWMDGVAHRWDRDTLTSKGSFRYDGEGWGLTNDGTSLIMSDGSAWLRFLDPETFEERRRVQVTAAGRPIRYLNELECVRGEIFANVWQTGFIGRIDPDTGVVKAWIDLRGLDGGGTADLTDNVLNGIAYDEATGRLFVTGKRWALLYEIKLKPLD